MTREMKTTKKAPESVETTEEEAYIRMCIEEARFPYAFKYQKLKEGFNIVSSVGFSDETTTPKDERECLEEAFQARR